MIYQPKCKIEIETVKATSIHDVDFDTLEFGKIFTDHMFVCDYENGAWKTPKIMPYQALSIEPSARVFHYGQAVFEGMKAYKDADDMIWLFRPDENFNRINKSAVRLAIPEFPEAYFFEGLKTLLNLESDWIKKGLGNSLYIRPFVIATEQAISASPSNAYKFMIICSPAKAYYTGDVRVLIAEKYSRSANGGVGFAKAAGNYAAQFYPTNLANKKGLQQIIWTDAGTHENLEEAGTMNIFFRIGDKLITAPNNDRILDGVTRKSLIQLAADNNIECEVRHLKVKELKDAARNGTLKEIFGAGTAAVVSPIIAFEHAGEVFELGKFKDSYANFLKEKLMNIQYNIDEDVHNWRYKV
ncbi:MAG: branched-chain amino acid aminotransferase [Bacteroidia bacterium]|nr:branched-chain amino acid aminotransferase [Bacteroidia bacterium]NND25302.1 branched-chain amino acid aminotransferase [Flavobacteriaceae bacterium]MBT8279602.1 branched-chain amino acid aminotransferase [Bacteroidia bacterium]NNK59298.1 branched-chain amino acid aminotransferase [Flavobacteriaceae bacterium]NNL34023.1 branched-chain amino acid aminotransferase [Flavobacteriaceae bacterium]